MEIKTIGVGRGNTESNGRSTLQR